MDVQYGDEVLQRLAVDARFRPDGWTPDVVRSYRRRHQSLVAAKDCEDLRRIMSLDLQIEHRHDGVHSSIRLIDRTRLVLHFDGMNTDQVTVVSVIESDRQEVAP